MRKQPGSGYCHFFTFPAPLRAIPPRSRWSCIRSTTAHSTAILYCSVHGSIRRLLASPMDADSRSPSVPRVAVLLRRTETKYRDSLMIEPEGVFYIRGSGGSADAMRYYGVRDQMLYTEGRLQKIRLLRLKLEQFRKQINKPYNGYEWEKELTQSTRYDTGAFETLLADVCDLIPAETGLLNKLLELARAANDLNIIIDPNTKFSNYHSRNTAEG